MLARTKTKSNFSKTGRTRQISWRSAENQQQNCDWKCQEQGGIREYWNKIFSEGYARMAANLTLS